MPRLGAVPRLTDLRHAFRSLRRARTAFGLATASLAIGIAMCVTMVGVLDAIVRPNIPVRQIGDLYEVSWHANIRRPPPGYVRPDVAGALRRLSSIAAVAGLPGYDGMVSGLASADGAVLTSAFGLEVPATAFAMLGARPLYGRFYVGEADPAIAGREVVISEPLWRHLYANKKRFSAFPLHVGGEIYNVVGVAEPRLERLLGPPWNMWVQAPDTSRAAPYRFRFGSPEPAVLVRVAPNVTGDQLRAALQGVSAALATAANVPTVNAQFHMTSLARQTAEMPVLAIAISWAALAVLLIACVNIANLQLVRGLARLRDLAVRVAVGASRADIVRVQLAESTIIAIAGGIAGLLLSFLLMNVVRITAPGDLMMQGFVDPQLSWRVAAASVALTALAAIVFGLVPALRVTRFDVNVLLQSGAGTGTTRRSHRYYGSLVVVEVAFAMALAVCAALLGTTVFAAKTMDYGYTSRELLAGTTYTGARDTTNAIIPMTVERWTALRALPEVASVSYEISADFDSGFVTTDDPSAERARHQMPQSDLDLVDRDFFSTLGATVRGPGFGPYDGTTPVAVLDSLAARLLFGSTDPVGHRIKLGIARSPRPWVPVVGVSKHILRDSKASYQSLAEPQIFVLDQTGYSVTPGALRAGSLWIARPKTTAAAAFPVLRDRLAPAAVAPLDEMNGRNRTARIQAFVASVFIAFAIVGLGLAMLGVYSVMAHSVAQRRREFGVRIAFGATGPSLARMVLLHVNIPILAGLALGLIAARWGEGTLGNYVGAFENIAQVVVYLAAPLAMFAAATGAGLSSALSASRTNAVEAIRGN